MWCLFIYIVPVNNACLFIIFNIGFKLKMMKAVIIVQVLSIMNVFTVGTVFIYLSRWRTIVLTLKKLEINKKYPGRMEKKNSEWDEVIFTFRPVTGWEGVVCTWWDIRSVNFFCFLKTSILQLGMVEHLKVRQECYRIENHYF